MDALRHLYSGKHDLGCPVSVRFDPYLQATRKQVMEAENPSLRRLCTCLSGCSKNPLADPDVFDECHCWCHDPDDREGVQIIAEPNGGLYPR